MQGKKQYTPQLFVSFYLTDRVPEDNFYRRLRETIDLRWLYKATKKYYGKEGQQSIDPVVFFRLMIIGYLENIISDRQIIRAAGLRLDMLYFIGYNIDETLPWHSTLSRTRKLYGAEVFKQLFKQVLKQCIDKGMVAGKRQSIDSVLVKANASMDSVVAKEILEDAEQYANELKEEDSLPQQEDDQKKAALAKPADLKVCDKEEKAGETKDKNEQQKRLSNTTHYSPVDGDARISTKTNKPVQLNYLGQVSVDTAHHVITNIESHHADKRDSQCLVAAVIHTAGNLQEAGDLKVEEVLCDGNYGSGESLQYLEQENITGYIPNPGSYKSEREGFTYHREGDYYTCSQGNVLTYKNTYADRDGYLKKEYRSERKDCKHCPLREKCLGKKGREKKINDTVDKPYYDLMHVRMQTAKGRRMRKIRQSTVEPVIGTLVNYTGMRKISSRGIEQANKCMLMAAVAYNLKKMMQWISKKLNTAVKEIKITTEKCFDSLFVLINAHSVYYNKIITSGRPAIYLMP